MYGKSRFIPVGKVPLPNSSEYTGQGNKTPVLTHCEEDTTYSVQHQWLPCEISIGDRGEAKITSYINNLRLEGNESLYGAIEQVISRATPLWKEAVRSTLYRYERHRLLDMRDIGYDYDAAVAADYATWAARQRIRRMNTQTNAGDDDVDDQYRELEYIRVPEPDPYEPRTRTLCDGNAASSMETFSRPNLQVIVKLDNVHLTPEKPAYDGGSWHIEVRGFPTHNGLIFAEC
jgi:hypothetical protein